MDRYVADTTSIISYFSDVFRRPPKISEKALRIIDSSFNGNTVLIIPSIVFIEIFKKWFSSEERSNQIRYEVYERIKAQPNIEIKPLEQEVLENFIAITDIEPDYNFDNHDKQVLASAMMLQAPLITSDTNIIRYNKRKNVIPTIIS
jgi:hypothetical protein